MIRKANSWVGWVGCRILGVDILRCLQRQGKQMGKKRLYVTLPKAPHSDTLIYVFLFFVALVIFYYLFIINQHEVNKILSTIMAPLAITLFVTSLLKLIPLVVDVCAQMTIKRRFAMFFGECILFDSVRYAFTDRKLSKFHQKLQVWDLNYAALGCEGKFIPLPEGVDTWISFQDIRAACYLSTAVAKYTDVAPRFVLDKEVSSAGFDNIDYTAVAVGLGFNTFTHLLARWTNFKLFKIKFDTLKEICSGHFADENPEFKSPNANVYTDYIIFDGRPLIPVSDHKDFSLIARIVPPQSPRKPSHYFFVCAGRTATGTAAAGHYLKHNWHELLELYSTQRKDIERDSLAVIIEHKIDRQGLVDIDSGERIAVDSDGALMFKFSR